MRNKKCGIYVIEVIGGNCDKIGWKYVGQGNNLGRREVEHFKELEKTVHFNSKLQNYYNKYGKKSLKFYILMEYPESELNFWETWWIKCFDSIENGFNFSPGGGVFPTRNRSGYLQNIITNEIVHFHSILEFASKYNLLPACVSAVLCGKANRVDEWFFPENEWRPRTLLDKYGKIHTFVSIKDFSIKHGLARESVCRLLKKKKHSHKGWTNPNDKSILLPSHSKEFSLVSPDGNIFIGKNAASFCRSNGLRPGSINRIMSGERKSHKGWKKYIP